MWRVMGIIVGVLALLLLGPTRQAAACDFGDVGCAGDQMTYNAMIIVARGLWMVNRLMLVIAYMLDAIRTIIIENLFLGAFTQLTSLVDQAIIPVAVLALTIAILAILITPITGTASPFNLRQIFIIVMLAPAILLGLGKWLGDLDKMRVDIGQLLYSAANNSGASSFIASLAADTGDLPHPPYLYGQGVGAGNEYACSGGTLIFRRYSGGVEGSYSLRPDELAANYLYAGVKDIHCPDEHTGDTAVSGLPIKWSQEGDPGWVHGDDIGDEDVGIRTAWKDKLNEGIIRLFLGLFVSALALVYYAAHLVFTLALVALWVGIPIGMLFGMFRKDFSWAGEFFKSGADTLRNSWVTSFIIGLLTAALISAAESGNATVFASIATGQLIFLVFTFFNALSTLKLAISALASLGSAVTGGGANLLGGAAKMVGGAAMTAATGGGSAALGLGMGALKGTAGAVTEAGRMGVLGAAATRESGSGTFGLAAALGRNAGVMRAGEIARTMGVLRGEGGDAVIDAMRTGAASTRKTPGASGGGGKGSGGVNFKAFNQQMKGSGKVAEKIQADRDARAAKQQEELEARKAKKEERRKQEGEQRTDAGIETLRKGNVAQRGVATLQAAPEATRRATGAATQAIRQTADRAATGAQALGERLGTNRDPYTMVAGAVSAGRTAMRRGVDTGTTAVRQGVRRGTEAVKAGGAALKQRGTQTVDSIRRGMDPQERFNNAWRLDEQGRRVRVSDPAEAGPPEDARRGNFSNEELRRDMQAGATVRFHEDETASIWGGPPPDAEEAPAPADTGVEIPVRLGRGSWVQTPMSEAAPADDDGSDWSNARSASSQSDPAPSNVGEDGEVQVRVVDQPRHRAQGRGHDGERYRHLSPDENLAEKAAKRSPRPPDQSRRGRGPQPQVQPQAPQAQPQARSQEAGPKFTVAQTVTVKTDADPPSHTNPEAYFGDGNVS
jgi:hypothetical protein